MARNNGESLLGFLRHLVSAGLAGGGGGDPESLSIWSAMRTPRIAERVRKMIMAIVVGLVQENSSDAGDAAD